MKERDSSQNKSYNAIIEPVLFQFCNVQRQPSPEVFRPGSFVFRVVVVAGSGKYRALYIVLYLDCLVLQEHRLL